MYYEDVADLREIFQSLEIDCVFSAGYVDRKQKKIKIKIEVFKVKVNETNLRWKKC